MRRHLPPGIHLPEDAARKVSASVRRPYIPDTCPASGPDRGSGRTLIPGDGAAGDQGSSDWACLPGDGGYAGPAACPVSATSWRYGLRRTRRLVSGRSHRPRSTWPHQARLPLPAVTHRYRRAYYLGPNNFRSPNMRDFITVLMDLALVT